MFAAPAVARKQDLEFEDWIDWRWLPWIEAEYGHTTDTITPEMWERFGDSLEEERARERGRGRKEEIKRSKFSV